MLVNVSQVEPVGGYHLRLTFTDGVIGEIDLTSELWGPMFEPLRDEALFRSVRVDPELGTVAWSNGADLDPEGLRAAVTVVQPAG